MDFKQKMFDLSRRLMGEEYGGTCPPPFIPPARRSRGYVSPLVSFVTVTNPTGAAIGDLALPLPIPARSIIVVSTRNANLSDSLFLSFKPLGLMGTPTIATGATAITPVGNETWLPLCNFAATAKSKIGCGWIFEDELAVQTLYLQMGQENGGAAGIMITFAVSNFVANFHIGNQS